jgi:hypothetical protein
VPGTGPEGGPAAGAVSRRAVLGGGAALTVPLLNGCGGDGSDASDQNAGRATANAALTLLIGAMSAEQELIALYEAARDAHESLARHLDPPLAHHREHLAVLRRHYVPGTGERANEGGGIPRPRSSEAAPDEASEALARLREAEATAASARVAEVAKAAPGLAQVLASIGACEAGHAAALALARPS